MLRTHHLLALLLPVALTLHSCGKSKGGVAVGGAPSPGPSPTPSPAPAPAPAPPATVGPMTLPLTSPLKYYNAFPFNNVYTLDVKIGGQTIESVLDTGSSNLLAIGDSTQCPGCQNEYGYSSTYSLTSAAKATDGNWSMNFEPIGAATVEGYTDTVAFGAISMPDFNFGLVTAEQGIPNIWGIAYGSLAEPEGFQQTPQTPLFDGLVAAGKMPNQFSIRLCALQNGSNITLGGFDTALAAKMSSVQWTPIVNRVWYTIGVTKMTMAGGGTSAPAWTWTPAAVDSLIVDSGTNPMVFPPDQIEPIATILAAVAAQNNLNIPSSFWPTQNGAGGFATVAAADIAKFPPITVTVPSFSDPGQTFDLTVQPTTYFQTRQDGERFIGIQPEPGNQFILGTAFLENFVVLHDRGALTSATSDSTARVGFYPIAGLCD